MCILASVNNTCANVPTKGLHLLHEVMHSVPMINVPMIIYFQVCWSWNCPPSCNARTWRVFPSSAWVQEHFDVCFDRFVCGTRDLGMQDLAETANSMDFPFVRKSFGWQSLCREASTFCVWRFSKEPLKCAAFDNLQLSFSSLTVKKYAYTYLGWIVVVIGPRLTYSCEKYKEVSEELYWSLNISSGVLILFWIFSSHDDVGGRDHARACFAEVDRLVLKTVYSYKKKESEENLPEVGTFVFV